MNPMKRLLASAPLLLAASPAFAAGALEGTVEQQGRDYTAILMFLAFVVATLGITYWAALRTKTTKDFYTARRRHHGLPERHRDRGRLHVGRLVPRDLGARLQQRL